ncbi:uncharacterized protein LOC106648072 [Trichogramma pretiosum]|uniref:uncharacterized protein LOC106648072 n=1 Tax=Trichogramma pretiosum TaxID=7493 RepID=UPI0006C99655|nr:uncharacterized protein LOC106648072 [Trichogramma pretiosum]
MKPVVVYLACAWLLAAIATSQAGLPPPPSRQDDVLVLIDKPNVAAQHVPSDSTIINVKKKIRDNVYNFYEDGFGLRETPLLSSYCSEASCTNSCIQRNFGSSFGFCRNSLCQCLVPAYAVRS